MIYRPPQCSEREPDGSWEDCTWATGVDLQNAAFGRQVVPTTRTEYEALRVAGGDGPAERSGDGSNYGQLATGMRVRYDWTPTVRSGLPFDQAWALMKPGMGAGWQGSMGTIPSLYRRWDVGFRGGHSFYVQREDTRDRVWLLNPQAPNSWPGEWLSKADLKSYYEGLRGAAIATVRIGMFGGLPDSDTEEEVIEIIVDPYPVPLPATGTNVDIYLPDGTHQRLASVSTLVIGTASIEQSTNRAPKGIGFVLLGKRPVAGWYAPEAQLTIEHKPGDPIADARAAGRESMRREVVQAAEAIP